MKSSLSVLKSGGLRTALWATLAVSSAQAQITVDGIRNGSDTGYTERAVQATTTNWGPNNAIANLHTAQDGSNLAISIGGRSDGNGLILFIDSKAGGTNFIPNNLITSGDEQYTINNLGSSNSAGMTFESGFTADYAVRIYGTGSDAYVARYNLQTGTRDNVGNAGPSNQGPSAFVTDIRAAWADASPPYNTAVNGVEMKLSLAAMGVPTGAGQTIKLMAILVNGGSDYASNQVIASRTSSNTDIGDGNNGTIGIKTINFETETGVQTISLTVDNTDTDGDGLNNSVDLDDDNDGLLDTVETSTGSYVSPTDTGTNPLIVDTDSDGVNDGLEVAGDQFGLGAGNVSNPNIANYSSMAIPGNFTSPQWQVDGSALNAMTRKGTSLTDQHIWTLDFRFADVGEIQYKYAANGSYTNSWGGPGGNAVSTIVASGFNTFTFNSATYVGSITRTVFADAASYLAAYGLSAGSDDDSDGILNENEFSGTGNINSIGNTDPLSQDTDFDALADFEDPNPLVPVPQSRDVIFNVDMSVQIAKGYFNPSTGAVVVKIFSGVLAGGGDLPMTDADSNGIYQTAAVAVSGNDGSNFGNFKFFNTTPGASNSGYETGVDRNFVLGSNGGVQYVPDPAGYFSGDASLPQSYSSWSGVSGYNLAPNDGRGADADQDGITNLQEFLFGTVPNAPNGSIITTTAGTGNIVLTWLQRTDVAGYTLLENTDLGLWSPSSITPVNAGDQSGVPAGYTRRQATVPTTNPKTFFRVKGVEF